MSRKCNSESWNLCRPSVGPVAVGSGMYQGDTGEVLHKQLKLVGE